MRPRDLLLIILLILAALIPIIYATLTTMSSWVYALIIAWILLGVVYISLARLKWK